MEQRVLIKIPVTQKPLFEVTVNGEKYEYPAGAEMEVPESVADVIQNIYDLTPKPLPAPSGDEAVVEPLTVTENGEYTAPDGVDGYNPVHVSVLGGDAELENKLFTLEGDCSYKFANGKWDWVVNEYGDRIKVGTITDLQHFLDGSLIEEFPVELDLHIESGTHNKASSIFITSGLKKAPYVRVHITKWGSTKKFRTAEIFKGCRKLEYIPSDFFNVFADDDVWDNRDNSESNSLFSECYMLRELPDLTNVAKHNNFPTGAIYYNLCSKCYVLRKVENLPVIEDIISSSSMVGIVGTTCMLNKLTFETNEDRTAQIRKWRSQTLSTETCGFATSSIDLTAYGIPSGKKVTDDATYQALKNDPDWWTQNVSYSRYNHDSAVETINSLPDTSAYLVEYGGTNTIKFKGQSGELTDGGAINTLTEEEIAVATAKGWTVTLS